METQTRLSRHNKFISAENIIAILSVSSDDSLHAEEGWRTYRPKCCGNNNKDEDNSPKTVNYKNHRPSSQKFKQLSFYEALHF